MPLIDRATFTSIDALFREIAERAIAARDAKRDLEQAQKRGGSQQQAAARERLDRLRLELDNAIDAAVER